MIRRHAHVELHYDLVRTLPVAALSHATYHQARRDVAKALQRNIPLCTLPAADAANYAFYCTVALVVEHRDKYFVTTRKGGEDVTLIIEPITLMDKALSYVRSSVVIAVAVVRYAIGWVLRQPVVGLLMAFFLPRRWWWVVATTVLLTTIPI